MEFFLGAHHPAWLERVPHSLFVSHRSLDGRKRFPRALRPWALDSGAFTEVSKHGRFITSPQAYVSAVRRYQNEVGQLQWAAPQDHMTEAWVLERSEIASTVIEAQRWTVDNYLTLRGLDDTLPIIPVLQGQTLWDYGVHRAMYARAGIDLAKEPLVGVGSVCRRQATNEIAEIIADLSVDLPLHGFGVKMSGLGAYGWMLASSDSMAWSFDGRMIRPCPVRGLASCANCMHHALNWRKKVMVECERRDPVQAALF